MGKERKSSEEIIPILLQLLTSQEQTLSKLSSKSKELGEYLSHETIERHLKLLLLIQDLLQDKVVHYTEQEIGDRVYKSAKLTKK